MIHNSRTPLVRLKPRTAQYSIDKILKSSGHTHHRLPPYHSELNTIENIWSIVERFLPKCSSFKEKFKSMAKGDWVNLCKHVKKIEQEYMEK